MHRWVTGVFLVVFWLSLLTYGALAEGDRKILPVDFTTLDGRTISVAELFQGNWALAFVILPGCPACKQMIAWFGRKAQAVPQINFLLVAPAATSELIAFVQANEPNEPNEPYEPATTPELIAFVQEHATEIRVLLDQDGILGSMFAVERAPTVFLTLDGMHIGRLDWPFLQQDLLAATAELAEFPDPIQLLGQAAPEFIAIDLVGREIALADLPRPLLMSFFNPYCPPCWKVLPALVEISGEVAVAVLVSVLDPGGLAGGHRERLNQHLSGSSVKVLLLEGFDVFDLYQVTATPTTILIDEKGVIVWTKEGLVDVQSLRNYLRTLEGS